jgi:hypothetical protein
MKNIFAFVFCTGGFLITVQSQTPILKSTTGVVTTIGASASVINENNGQLGIGTASPASFLHLYRQQTAVIFGGPPPILQTGIRLELNHVLSPGNTQYNIVVAEDEFFIGRTVGNTKQFRMHSNEIDMKATVRTTGTGSGNINSVFTLTDNNIKEIGWTNQVVSLTNQELTTPLTFKYDPNGSASLDRVIMTMETTGQVRIGDANTTYANYVNGSTTFNEQMRLTVEGGVVAQHYVNTTQNWADFVFDSCAVNPTLDDERTSIEKNKTLVGVPSEADVKNGTDMANTDMILLMKIEQNYLNDLNQQDILRGLVAQMELLKQENVALQLQVNTLMLKLEGK